MNSYIKRAFLFVFLQIFQINFVYAQNMINVVQKKEIRTADILLKQLTNALLESDVNTVAQLFPLYLKLPKSYQTEDIKLWSLAILNAIEGNYVISLKNYEILNALYPNMLPLKFQWGMLLFRDKRYYEARKIFEELGNKIDSKIFQQILANIELNNKWNLLGNFNIVSNYNINQGNKKQKGWTFGTPKHTYGIHLGKKMEFAKRFFYYS